MPGVEWVAGIAATVTAWQRTSAWLDADPSRSVAIEDSAPGIASARAAGMKTVAIPHWLTERHELSGADLRVAHAGELTVARLTTLIRT